MIDPNFIAEIRTRRIYPNHTLNGQGTVIDSSKWGNEHWSSILLWDLHSQGVLSGVHDWSHEGDGFWMLVKLDGPTLVSLGLADCENCWVEIHERNDGIMETSYWNDAEAAELITKLDQWYAR